MSDTINAYLLKRRVEEIIKAALDEFTERTGARVTDVEVYVDRVPSNMVRTYDVKLKAEL